MCPHLASRRRPPRTDGGKSGGRRGLRRAPVSRVRSHLAAVRFLCHLACLVEASRSTMRTRGNQKGSTENGNKNGMILCFSLTSFVRCFRAVMIVGAFLGPEFSPWIWRTLDLDPQPAGSFEYKQQIRGIHATLLVVDTSGVCTPTGWNFVDILLPPQASHRKTPEPSSTECQLISVRIILLTMCMVLEQLSVDRSPSIFLRFICRPPRLSPKVRRQSTAAKLNRPRRSVAMVPAPLPWHYHPAGSRLPLRPKIGTKGEPPTISPIRD